MAFFLANQQVRCRAMFNKVWLHSKIIESTVIRSDKWCLHRMDTWRQFMTMAVVTGCHRQQKATVAAHLNATFLPLSLSLSPIFLVLYPNESVFQRASKPPAATLKRGKVLHCSHWQTSSDECIPTGDSHWQNAVTHVCTRDAWLTTITVHYTVNALSAGELALFFHFKCPPSLRFVLH